MLFQKAFHFHRTYSNHHPAYIDINELPLVINYDLPDVPETYVHRIGRTGRAGNLGTALTFCSQEERKLVNDIQKLTGKKLSKVEFAI